MADEYFDQVLGTMSRTGGGVAQLVVGVAKAEILLLMWLYKAAKKGISSLTAADDYKSFLAAHEGHVQGTSIILSEESAEALKAYGRAVGEDKYISPHKLRELPEIKELESLKAKFYVMPAKPGEAGLQLIVADNDMPVIKAWHQKHLNTLSKGGLKDYEYFKTLTSGQFALQSINLEGAEFSEMCSDLTKLGASYSILPDLKVGDGRSQFAIANKDLSKLDFWVKQKNAQEISAGSGAKTVIEKISEDTYLNTADGVEKDRFDMFSGTDKNFPEEGDDFRDHIANEDRVLNTGAGQRDTSNHEYIKLHEDANYKEISVNQVLVDAVPQDLQLKANEQGAFICAIPGKDRSEFLMVPLSSSFVEGAGENYRLFLDKAQNPIVLNKDGSAASMGIKALEARWNKAKEGAKILEQLSPAISVPKTLSGPPL